MKKRPGERSAVIRNAGLLAAALALLVSPANARDVLNIVATSNIEGRSSLGIREDKGDFLLGLGRSILGEKRRAKAELYVDLGNAFYPGPLSKFSFGSVMMDFFEFFECAATLVSSKDLRIGIDNLGIIQNNRKTRLLSANIARGGGPVFAPYFLYRAGTSTIAFVGLTSKNVLVDIAEKNLYDIAVEDHLEVLEKTMGEARSKGAQRFVLLSGLNNTQNVAILKRFGDIDLVIAGGDNRGMVAGAGVHRVDFAEGRSIVMLHDKDAYYTLSLRIDDRLSVTDFRRNEVPKGDVSPGDAAERGLREFAERQDIWKKKYAQEGLRVIADVGEPAIVLDGPRAANLLRHHYNAEVSVLAKNTMKDAVLTGKIRQYDLNDIARDEFPLFLYRLTGADLTSVSAVDELLFSGYENGKVQGYAVDPARRYRVVSTQTVYEQVRNKLKARLPYDNRWESLPELIGKDITGPRAAFLAGYGYLDRRFRMTLDVKLSNFYELLDLSRDGDFTSPGGPTSPHTQWGLENSVTAKIYNRYHGFIVNPYMFYVEMNQEIEDPETGEKGNEKFIVQNLLRGLFEYKLNYFDYVNPYHKSQIDTVVKRDTEGMRPAVIRETAGAGVLVGAFEGRLGAGFERKVHDPKEEPVYGIEAFLSWKAVFLTHFSYQIKIDSFMAKTDADTEGEGGYLKSEVDNAFTVKLNSLLGVSLKHKWFYYYSDREDKSYSYKLFLTSLDLKTDFKLY